MLFFLSKSFKTQSPCITYIYVLSILLFIVLICNLRGKVSGEINLACNIKRSIFDLIRITDYYRDYVIYVGRIGQLTHVTILLKHVTAHIHLTRNIFRTRCYPDVAYICKHTYMYTHAPHHEISHTICPPCLQSAGSPDVNACPRLLCY